MKHLQILFLALCSSTMWGQTGTAVVFLNNGTYEFTPTTVDSSLTAEFQLVNTIGAAQTIYFGGLGAPFALADGNPVELASQDTLTIEVSFSPTSIGVATDTLEVIGSIFGNASLILTGEGIQVQLEWSGFEVEFGTTAIGATSYADLVVTNTGNGTATLDFDDSQSEIFSVELIDDFVDPGLGTPCGSVDGVDFYPFTLTVTPGIYADFGTFNWYVYPNGYTDFFSENGVGAAYYFEDGGVGDPGYLYNPYDGSSYPVLEPLDMCLPLTSESGYELYWYVYSDYCDFEGTSFKLEDAYGNVVWEQDDWEGISGNYCDYGSDYDGVYPDIEVGPAPVPPFTAGSLAEGETQIARFSFTPQNVGDTTQVLSISTNSPTMPTANVTCSGTAVAELEGDVCANLTLANSPFQLVGPVVIPEGCSVTVEAGVEIIQNGNPITVFGDFQCLGTEAQPINLYGGGLDLRSGPATTLNHVNRIAPNQTQELVYIDNWSNFQSIVGISSPQGGGYNWYNETGSSWEGSNSSNGNSSLWISKSDYPGYFTSIDSVYAPISGVFEFSFIWQNGTIEYLCSWSFEVWDGNTWVEKINTPLASSTGTRKNYARAEQFFEEGDLILWRFKLNPYDTNSSYDYIDLNIDEFRIGSVRNEVLSSSWDIHMIADSLNLSTENSNGLSIHEDTLRVSASNNDFQLVTSNELSFPIFTVPSDGYYYLTFDYRNLGAEDYCYANLGITISGGDSYAMFQDYPNPDYSGTESNDWKQFTVHCPDWLANGTQIHLDLGAYVQSNSDEQDEITWEVTDMRLHQISPLDGVRRDISSSNLAVAGIIGEGAILTLENSTINELILANGQIISDDCQFEQVELTLSFGEFTESSVNGSDGIGIRSAGDNVNLILHGCDIRNHGSYGVLMPDAGASLDIDYCLISDNGDSGVRLFEYNTTCTIDNSLLAYNSGTGLYTFGSADVNYSTIVHNGGYGMYIRDFSTVNNSILWFNNANPQMYAHSNAVYASSYTNVQGINALLTDENYAWGEGCIGTDPVLADDQGHLDPYSPCVDGGMPWEQDAHIPYGLGSSRADMGMYGGPANEYWGGQAPPDGAVQITDVFDIPQDQGGFVGMHFTASPFDFGGLGFNVTHYSIWRDLALGSDAPADVSDGNWEEIGTVPAQGFNQYGYTAATLMDAYPGETACLTSFIVIAHTTDDNIYWVSDVAAACSEDNLAPAIPELGGMVLADADDEAVALLSWALPEEEDYAYTVVTGDHGFNGTVSNGDTLITDASLEPGALVAYEAIHFDVHGNASDAAILALEAPMGEDLIALREGWNLISSDRIPDAAALETVMASLTPGNLQYVIAFDAGVQFYDPSGLSFLNTLSSWKEGYGHWVKVAADDTLRVQGSRLGDDFMPGLAEGWNLVGYAAEAPAAPGNVFADLEATGDLLYVTGFDQGVQVYDPNGLPFLNTLTQMRNGFGYWVKSAVASDGDVLAPLSEDKTPLQVPSPRYDVVNGISELAAYAGEFVDVVNGWGVTVARLPILEGGHLMTTAIFGDDPATGAVEGLADGETLHFAFRGAMANETMVFGGDMAHKTLALTFDEVDAAMGVFPNPASDVATFRFHVVMDAQVKLTLVDLAGRQVAVLLDANKGVGAHAETLALPAVQAGAYTVQMSVAGELTGTQRLVVTH